jgi:hypothetical protein
MQAEVLAVLLATYVVSLGLSRLMIDHRTPFDGRILLPAQVLLVALLGLALPRLDPRRLPQLAAWLAAAAWLVVLVVKTGGWMATHAEGTWGSPVGLARSEVAVPIFSAHPGGPTVVTEGRLSPRTGGSA